MQLNERAKANSQGAIEKRREKERKREEKELRKAAKAAGVKLSTATPVVSVIDTTQNPTVATTTPGTESTLAPPEKKSGFTAGSWSAISSSSSGGGFKKSGWTAVSSSPKPLPPPPEPSHVTPFPPPVTSTSAFRSGGWTTLEGPPSASTPNRPLMSNVYHTTPTYYPIPPPPEPASTPNPPEPSNSGSKPILITEKPAKIQPQPTSQPAKNHPVGKRAEASRSGWQNFSRGGPRR